METSVYQDQKNKLLLHRRLLLVGLSGTLLLNFILSGVVLYLVNNIVVHIESSQVEHDFSISNKGVSSSYIEEMASYWGHLLLTVNKANAQSRMDYLLKHVDPKYFSSFKNMLATQLDVAQNQGVHTVFTVTKIQPDNNKLSARVHGELRTYYGSKQYNTVSKRFLVKFTLKDRKLFLKSFSEEVKKND